MKLGYINCLHLTTPHLGDFSHNHFLRNLFSKKPKIKFFFQGKMNWYNFVYIYNNSKNMIYYFILSKSYFDSLGKIQKKQFLLRAKLFSLTI